MSRVHSWIRAVRPRQWAKNAAVLAPAFFAAGDPGQVHGMSVWLRSAGAAGMFCLLSSAVYLYNDACDVASDRAHPLRKNRPVASGEISRSAAYVAAAVLAMLGMSVALGLGASTAWVAAAYLLLQAVYSPWLKKFDGVDVLVVASGFDLRALAGGAAAGVDVSPWLLVCAFLLALFLVLCKRRAHAAVQAGGGADSWDTPIAVAAAGTVLGYAMYTLAVETLVKFGTRNLIFTLPFVVYGIFRYLQISRRPGFSGDPEYVLFRDRPTGINLALYTAAVAAILLHAK